MAKQDLIDRVKELEEKVSVLMGEKTIISAEEIDNKYNICRKTRYNWEQKGHLRRAGKVGIQIYYYDPIQLLKNKKVGKVE